METQPAANFEKRYLEVLSHPHGLCSVQDLPGRLGFWDVGIPPSGPMDSRAFTAANRLVDNPDETPALELTECGLTVRFQQLTDFAVTGAEMALLLNGSAVPFYTRLTAQKGDILQFGRLKDRGFRAYLAVRGGFDAASGMGSCSTFIRGNLGTVLSKGDRLTIGNCAPIKASLPVASALSNDWKLRVHVGPHALTEYISNKALQELLNATWTVSDQLDRSGVRLKGPNPEWARKSGGIAGLNPSNVMDTPYSIGAVNFMGDTPVITGVDGPSLGGFACLFCVVDDDLWKLGQLAPGDRIQFRVVSDSAELGRLHLGEYQVHYLQSGTHAVLAEYGPAELNLELRMRVYMLREALASGSLPGIIQLTPGVRGLLVEFNPDEVSAGKLVDQLKEVERTLASESYPQIPARRVRLPLSWEDPQIVYAVQRYMQSICAEAEWCPDNIDFVRKLNGFESKEALRDFFFATDFLVLGLGDVYMGAPLALAVDPKRRLRSTKYSPARTWTPEGAVGLGGQYLCIYGMESPGGYQLVGRTLPTWKSGFDSAGNLFNWFDRISFYPVTSKELDLQIARFKAGEQELETEAMQFDWNHLKERL